LLIDNIGGYLDPCEHDFENHFTLLPDGCLKAQTTVAAYMIERMHLNRPQIVKQRRRRRTDREEYETEIKLYDAVIGRMKATADQGFSALVEPLQQARDLRERRWNSRWDVPYEMEDLRSD
jgi:hypothetical protein